MTLLIAFMVLLAAETQSVSSPRMFTDAEKDRVVSLLIPWLVLGENWEDRNPEGIAKLEGQYEGNPAAEELLPDFRSGLGTFLMEDPALYERVNGPIYIAWGTRAEVERAWEVNRTTWTLDLLPQSQAVGLLGQRGVVENVISIMVGQVFPQPKDAGCDCGQPGEHLHIEWMSFVGTAHVDREAHPLELTEPICSTGFACFGEGY